MLYLREEIQQRSAGGASGKSNPVWIPYGQLLAEILPSNKGSDSRSTNRIFALLNIIPLTKAHLRPRLVYGLELLVVATLDDLREVLHITQDVTGIPVYKLKFYKETFLTLFRSKKAPDVGENGKREPRIALTSREICDYYSSTKDIKPITVDNLKKTFLDELLNHGYIEQETSVVNAKQNIYYPLIGIEDEQSSLSLSLQDGNTESTTSNSSNEPHFDKDLQYSSLILPTNCKRIPDNWLNLEILELMSYRADPKFKLLDKDGNQFCICSFIKHYENSLRLSRFIKKSQNATFSKIFGAGIKEIAGMSQLLHNKKSNLAQFDEKDNNDNTMALGGADLDDSIQRLSSIAGLPSEHDNNTTIRQTCARESVFMNKPQQCVIEGLKDKGSSSLLQHYVTFDLEWISNDNNSGTDNRTIYAAAFVDNHGNQKVLHISDFAGSEPALLKAITEEILKYSASIGWYTTGIARASGNQKGMGGVSAAA